MLTHCAWQVTTILRAPASRVSDFGRMKRRRIMRLSFILPKSLTHEPLFVTMAKGTILLSRPWEKTKLLTFQRHSLSLSANS